MNPVAGPRVSVIIAAHNRLDLLIEAVSSVRSQSYPVYETIVVDDGSTPRLDADALLAAGGPSVRIERHEQPKRTAGAKNTGIQCARGDLITFLDDDDLLAPTYIESAVRIMARNPYCQVLFMGVTWFGKLRLQGEASYREGMAKTLQEVKADNPEPGVLLFAKDLYPALLKRVPMAFQRTVVRRQAFEQVGMYRERCALQDCDWAIRAARLVPCTLFTDGLYLQRTDGQGAASRPERKEQHAYAKIDILEHLLLDAMREPCWSDEATLLRKSLATAWFDLAYHYANTQKPVDALQALIKGQRKHHLYRRWKLAAKLAMQMLNLGNFVKIT